MLLSPFPFGLRLVIHLRVGCPETLANWVGISLNAHHGAHSSPHTAPLLSFPHAMVELGKSPVDPIGSFDGDNYYVRAVDCHIYLDHL